jgi:hypothetical protein
MATVWTILTTLRAELEDRISNLTPHGYASYRFAVRDRHEQDASKVDDAWGRERLVEIGDAVNKGISFIASSTIGFEMILPIRIAYPTTGSWPIACVDDFEMIAENMRDTASTTSGVALCVVDGEPTVAAAPKDNWQILTINLLVVLDATF